MSFLEATILGILQGLTEFLPVSSSGHLTVGQFVLGLKLDNLTFDVAVHFGTLLSVLTVYRKVVKQIIVEVVAYFRTRVQTPGVRVFFLTLVGSIPAGIVGVGFKSMFEEMFHSLTVVAVGFFITGILLFLTKFRGSGKMGGHFVERLENADHISYKQVILVGLMQAIAIVPGISRSGSTIAAGLLGGMDRSSAAMMSFMLAIPAIFGATLLQLRDISSLSGENLLTFAVGIVTAYVTGLFGLKVVLSFVKEGRIHLFGFYVWALGLFLIFGV